MLMPMRNVLPKALSLTLIMLIVTEMKICPQALLELKHRGR
jgi:hypothetical protein